MIIKKDSGNSPTKMNGKLPLAIKAKKESMMKSAQLPGRRMKRSQTTKIGKRERKSLRSGDPNQLIVKCLKPPRDRNPRALLLELLGVIAVKKMMEKDIQDRQVLIAQALNEGQICDNKCRVIFSEHDSEITKDGKIIGRGIRKKGLYVMKLGNKPKDKICLATIDENSTLWHRRLGHANMCLIQSLASKELVRNLPKLKFDQHFCDACKIGKQAHFSHKAKNIVSTTRMHRAILHMDLFGLDRRYSQNSKAYIILNKHTRKIEESLNVTFDETPPPSKTSPLVDDDQDEEEAIKEIEKKNLENIVEDETLEIDKIVNIKESRNHPLENVIGNLNQRTLRS
ncbi:retrovirus-related pol polyprotein from transposon TNT 1-94 [Tanacetum coccineum]